MRIGLARPDIASVIEAAQAAARSDAAAAGRWPNPTLELQHESVPGALGSATERTYLLSQQFDLSGKRGIRKNAANERVLAAAFDGDQRRQDIAAAIRRRFYEVLYRRELVAATRAWDSRMAPIAATVQKLHKGGEVAGYDKRRMELERATAQARLRAEQADYDKAWQQLAALLGAGAAQATPSGELLPPDAPPLDTLLARLDQRPQLRALERRADAHALERKAAQRGWMPDVTVGIGSKSVDSGVARDRGTVLSVSVPLPIFDRDQAGAGKAGAQADEARAEARLQRSRLEGELRGAWQQVRQLSATARDYQAQAANASDELARIAEASYRGGETGILELLDVYRATHEARMRALELSWSARQGAIELDTIVGNEKP
ncbi:TolC family protein [Massilia frigida]|uniref:TolC family protein n=1 Tax=Massilia frigida TaxID=2609281 RepID=UPI001422D3BD